MTISAGLGLAGFPFDSVQDFWTWVDLCDGGGVDSIWQSDRIISAEPNLECMSLMAALAGRTRKLKFGMNVASLGLRDPVLTAKACATIDFLSNGRLLPAFGVGSAISRDYSATGIPTKGRGQRTDEGLQILTRLWREESVTFTGRHYRLEDACISPKPVQDPLPLWVGGSAAEAIERTARWGTGWQAGIENPEQVAPVIEAIKSALVRHGRTIDEDHYGAGFGFRFGRPDEPVVARQVAGLAKRLGREPTGYFAIGGVDEIMGLLNAFRAAGVHKFVLRPVAQGTTDVLAQTQRFIEEVLPVVAELNPHRRKREAHAPA